MTTRAFILIVAGAALATAGCHGQPPPDLRKAEAEVRAADAAWLEAAGAHDLERTVAYWSGDAVLMAPGVAPVRGKEALRKYVSDAFATPDFSITWTLDAVQVAKSADLAYATGSNQISLTTPDGKHVVERNQAVEVWRKDPDGAWRCVLDIASPMPGAS
jgi:uncharacterized protein (TIGR02246 family)